MDFFFELGLKSAPGNWKNACNERMKDYNERMHAIKSLQRNSDFNISADGMKKCLHLV